MRVTEPDLTLSWCDPELRDAAKEDGRRFAFSLVSFAVPFAAVPLLGAWLADSRLPGWVVLFGVLSLLASGLLIHEARKWWAWTICGVAPTRMVPSLVDVDEGMTVATMNRGPDLVTSDIRAVVLVGMPAHFHRNLEHITAYVRLRNGRWFVFSLKDRCGVGTSWLAGMGRRALRREIGPPHGMARRIRWVPIETVLAEIETVLAGYDRPSVA